MTKVLTVGGGGREHAAVEALARAGAEIYAVMKNANPGIIARAKEYILADERDKDKICDFALQHNLEYAFVGPEAPLEAGLVDALENIGIGCAAPTRAAARIETSKSFMRELVERYGIPGNLEYASFGDAASTRAYLEKIDFEVAVKPVGLTGGKGVKVQGEHLHNMDDTMEYVNEIFDQKVGGAGVILERRAVGEEFTQMVFSDGKRITPMPMVQDHKRAYEGDVGPNTGGMGSYTDSNHLLPFLDENDRNQALNIIQKVIDALAADGTPYRGPLYGQFMLTSDGPKIIEFNARFGDPEAMNVLSVLESDFMGLVKDISTGKMKTDAAFAKKATVCKYVVPKGYGVKSDSGHPISVDEEGVRSCGARVYYANVDVKNGVLVTGTSRSVGIVGIADTIEEAERNCEAALAYVKCDAVYVRHDIGKAELIQRRIDHMKQIRK